MLNKKIKENIRDLGNSQNEVKLENLQGLPMKVEVISLISVLLKPDFPIPS